MGFFDVINTGDSYYYKGKKYATKQDAINAQGAGNYFLNNASKGNSGCSILIFALIFLIALVLMLIDQVEMLIDLLIAPFISIFSGEPLSIETFFYWVVLIPYLFTLYIISIPIRKFLGNRLFTKAENLYAEGKITESFKLFEKCALRYKNGFACYIVGLAYLFGDNVDKDYEKAIKIFKIGCRSRDKGCYAELGYEYTNNIERFPNMQKKGNKYLKKAKSKGITPVER